MIAVDAMGGDFAPDAIIEGAFYAAKLGVPVFLFGNEQLLLSKLNILHPKWRQLPIEIKHCSQAIGMHEEPTRVVLHKQDSSLVCAAKALVNNNAQALVSAGNSGAVLVASTLIIGRAKGVLRPAIGGFLPSKESSIFCLDLGANTDCKPEYLEQFAYMGHAYVRLVKNITKPRVALLSNGHEAYKGSMLVRQAFALLDQSIINFVGNLEARDVFDDHADVLVCDGFVGNVLLKSSQGLGRVLFAWMQQEAKRSLLNKLMVGFSLPILRSIKQRIDYKKSGGALLLGIKKPVVLAHGCSDAHTIKNAIMFAHEVVQQNRVAIFNALLEELLCKATAKNNQKPLVSPLSF